MVSFDDRPGRAAGDQQGGDVVCREGVPWSDHMV